MSSGLGGPVGNLRKDAFSHELYLSPKRMLAIVGTIIGGGVALAGALVPYIGKEFVTLHAQLREQENKSVAAYEKLENLQHQVDKIENLQALKDVNAIENRFAKAEGRLDQLEKASEPVAAGPKTHPMSRTPPAPAAFAAAIVSDGTGKAPFTKDQLRLALGHVLRGSQAHVTIEDRSPEFWKGSLLWNVLDIRSDARDKQAILQAIDRYEPLFRSKGGQTIVCLCDPPIGNITCLHRDVGDVVSKMEGQHMSERLARFGGNRLAFFYAGTYLTNDHGQQIVKLAHDD
jgi:hypothetical protein